MLREREEGLQNQVRLEPNISTATRAKLKDTGRSQNIAVLLPCKSDSIIPSLGYAAISQILNQAFPEFEIYPVFQDTQEPPQSDILLYNAYSAWGMIETKKVFNKWGWGDPTERAAKVIFSGPGVYNPLPFFDMFDYVSFSERALVNLISKITKIEPKSWSRPNLIWAKTPYLMAIMPNEGCRYRCSFCQLVVQHNFSLNSASLDSISRVLKDHQSSRIQVHSASILQYPHFTELIDLLEQSGSEIYFGSMNLIEVDDSKTSALKRVNPRHTVNVENKTNDSEVYFGLESGNPQILQAMIKPLNIPTAIEKVRILAQHGFSRLGFYLILGYPNTGIDDAKLTAELLNTFAGILDSDSRIRVKCTPFLPLLGTADKDKEARSWIEHQAEYEFLVQNTDENIAFDISEASYYLINLVLMRGLREHSRLVDWLVINGEQGFDNNKKVTQVLQTLNLPSFKNILTRDALIDLSCRRNTTISANEISALILK